MTKKDFIKEIRELNRSYRAYTKHRCEGIYINNIYFCFDHIKLCFDDDFHVLFIYDRNRKKIMASVHYQDVRIGLNVWDK